MNFLAITEYICSPNTAAMGNAVEVKWSKGLMSEPEIRWAYLLPANLLIHLQQPAPTAQSYIRPDSEVTEGIQRISFHRLWMHYRRYYDPPERDSTTALFCAAPLEERANL